MDLGYLKDLLSRGREVEFVFASRHYTVKRVLFASTTEYAFGQKWGDKVTSSYFDELFYRRIDGYSLSEMLQRVSSNQIYIY
ncbi:hypothetical protein IKG13_00210 [Candidatus Saccharibacteria bacterium]|jgi:hypothetical protein|nr:hypothetical protein [Candidatus Saccharibacteria bacterium]MBR3378442.1 hypothetical protein [Candidatus Saccharibacteria bacterium]